MIRAYANRPARVLPPAASPLPATGIRSAFGVPTDSEDRIARIACSVAGRAARLGVIRYTTRKGVVGCLVRRSFAGVGDGRIAPRTQGEQFRDFPDYGDMYQSAYLAGLESVRRNPSLTDAQIGGYMKFRLVNVITGTGRDEDRAQKAGKSRATRTETVSLRPMILSQTVSTLTEREQAMVGMVGRGMTQSEIGDALGIAQNTVADAMRKIRNKLAEV